MFNVQSIGGARVKTKLHGIIGKGAPGVKGKGVEILDRDVRVGQVR